MKCYWSRIYNEYIRNDTDPVFINAYTRNVTDPVFIMTYIWNVTDPVFIMKYIQNVTDPIFIMRYIRNVTDPIFIMTYIRNITDPLFIIRIYETLLNPYFLCAYMYKNNFDMPYIAVQFMRKCFVLIGNVMNYVTMLVISDLSIFVYLSYHISCWTLLAITHLASRFLTKGVAAVG